MLQKLRDQTQSLGFKILVAVIIFVLAIFGFGAFNCFDDLALLPESSLERCLESVIGASDDFFV